MGPLLIFGLLAAVGYYSYKHGKRLGSRLAYRIGRRHARRRRRLRGGIRKLRARRP
jgi:hypothetical protein